MGFLPFFPINERKKLQRKLFSKSQIIIVIENMWSGEKKKNKATWLRKQIQSLK